MWFYVDAVKIHIYKYTSIDQNTPYLADLKYPWTREN